MGVNSLEVREDDREGLDKPAIGQNWRVFVYASMLKAVDLTDKLPLKRFYEEQAKLMFEKIKSDLKPKP